MGDTGSDAHRLPRGAIRNKAFEPEAIEVAEALEDLGMAIAWVDRIADRYEKAYPELAKPDPPAG
jgi:hypothetical protein